MKPLLILFLIIALSSSCGKEPISNNNPNTPTLSTPTSHAFDKVNDIKWASPKGFDLTMDIYTPKTGKTTYPVIIIFHGGGWLVNNKSIMNQMSEYLAKYGEYVVCNVNYRLLGDLGNTVLMNEIIEDGLGAVLWIKENIAKYKGDATKIIVTGDSAGGHMATMIATQGHNLESDGFKGTTLGFNPTYLPTNKTAETVAKENGVSVQAAIINYGLFDIYGSCLTGMETPSNIFWNLGNTKPRGLFGGGITVQNNPDYYKQVSPFYFVPKVSERKLPPTLFTVGSRDNLTTPASIEAYINKLKEAGHTNTEYWIYQGFTHAFLDSNSNFNLNAPTALDKMLAFLNKIFY